MKNDMGRFPRSMFPSVSEEHLYRYFRVIGEGLEVDTHSDLLRWLQGEIQHYLPHEIILAVWFDVGENNLRHDLVSALPGVRTGYLQSEDLLALQRRLHGCWVGLGRIPFRFNLGEFNYEGDGLAVLGAFGKAIYGMRSLLVHGIRDMRGGQDYLYIIFNSTACLDNSNMAALESLLPHLDTALRRMEPWDGQHDLLPPVVPDAATRNRNYGLTPREAEVLYWVRIGKTNSEIASILEISVFTVKNHMQSIFKKLEVGNRTQAVAMLGSPRRLPNIGHDR